MRTVAELEDMVQPTRIQRQSVDVYYITKQGLYNPFSHFLKEIILMIKDALNWLKMTVNVFFFIITKDFYFK